MTSDLRLPGGPVGEWELRNERPEAAISRLEESMDLKASEVAAIKLAEACIDVGEYDRARVTLEPLALERIPRWLRLEFLAARSALAISTGDVEAARWVAKHLSRLDLRELYFQRTCDSLRLELANYLANAERKPASRSGGRHLLRRFFESIELRPTFMGIGVDLNRLIGLTRTDGDE